MTHDPSPSAEAVVRGLYATIQQGDIEALERFVAPDIVFEVPGDSPNAGRYEGVAAFKAFLAGAAERTQGSLRLALHDVAVGGGHVIAVATYTAQRPGRKPLENNLCHLMRVERGRVAYSRFYTGDQYAVDAFWKD